MVRFAIITVVLSDGAVVKFNNTTLLEVAKQCLQHPLANSNPVLLKVGTEYNLYFNNDVFISWIKKEIDLEEILNELRVDVLVRNKTSITASKFIIEEGSLWLVKNNLCVLADVDSFVSVKMDNRFKLLG